MSLRYSIDSAAYCNGLLYGWGWYLHDDASAKRIFLVLKNADGVIIRLRCGIDRTRPDVAHAFPSVLHANYAGLIFQGKIPKNFNGTAKLEVELVGGEILEHVIPGFPQSYSGESFEPRIVGGQLRRGWRHLRAGRWSHISSRLRQLADNGGRKFLQFTRRNLHLSPRSPLVLIVDHQLGGGANKFSNDKLAALQKTGRAAALLSFNLPKLRFELLHSEKRNTTHHVFTDLAAVFVVLETLNITEIIVNDLVSYPDPLNILRWVKSIKANKHCKLSLYLHDFFAVCPTWTLINAEGVFCRLPKPDVCRQCLAAMPVYFPSFIEEVDIMDWRRPWLDFMNQCDEIVAFSQSTLDLYTQAFSDLRWLETARVQPHLLLGPTLAKVDAKLDLTLVIAIIGNISVQKGARIVKEMARLITQQKLDARIVVLGTLDEMELSPCLDVTGPYHSQKLPELMRQHRVSVCLLPSICPETFSYATSEIMEMQLPLAVFDLGAPAERVRNYPNGVIIGTPTAEAALASLFRLRDLLVEKRIENVR